MGVLKRPSGTFQDLAYGYDKVGNILSRTNDVQPMTSGHGNYHQGADSGNDAYSLHMDYDGIHNIVNKAQVHVRSGSDGVESVVKGTSYTWDYAYEGNKPHAPTVIGDRHFSYDANGNQLGWTQDNGKASRHIFWDDENHIQRINDDKATSLFAYDDQGQRKVKYVKNNKANTAKTTYYVNQYYQLTNDVLVTKHIFVGSTRLVTKHAGGSIVFRTKPRNTRSSQGRKSNTIPGNYKAEQLREKGNNGKAASAPGYIKSADKGNRYANGHSNANANNGKGKGQQNDHANNGNGKFADGQFPGQGIYHRSDRANEVAQNVNKNPNLQYLKEDPSSPWYGDGATAMRSTPAAPAGRVRSASIPVTRRWSSATPAKRCSIIIRTTWAAPPT